MVLGWPGGLALYVLCRLGVVGVKWGETILYQCCMKHWSGLISSCSELHGPFWVAWGWLKPVVKCCDYPGKRFSKSRVSRWQNT